MGKLTRAIQYVGGTVSPVIQRATCQDLDNLVRRVVEGAATKWVEDGCPRFNHEEVNCTVQIFARADRIIREDRRLGELAVEPESIELTSEVLAGLASAATVGRPDLRFKVGSVASRIVECKRLSNKGPLAKRYVDDGMQRFVDGKYGQADPKGTMVGYIEEGSEVDTTNRINVKVRANAVMGPGHELSSPVELGTQVTRRESTHTRSTGPPIGLDHILIDLIDQ